MSDPSRLVDNGATDLERLVIEAGIREEPGAEGARKTAAILGVAAVVSSASPVVAAATAAGKLWWASWAPWALIAVSGPGLAIALALTLERSPREDDRTPASLSERRPNTPPSLPPRTNPGEPPSARGVASQEAPKEPPAAANSAASPRRGAVSERSSSLKDEVASLDQARSRLHRGDPAGALRVLDRHVQKYRGGVLAEEAMLLRIEALAQSGNRPAAERLARQLLARNPGSPHAKRLASLLGPAIVE